MTTTEEKITKIFLLAESGSTSRPMPRGWRKAQVKSYKGVEYMGDTFYDIGMTFIKYISVDISLQRELIEFIGSKRLNHDTLIRKVEI